MPAIRSNLAIIALLTATLLAGCSQYLDRKDTIAFGAGDAVETNMATHIIDPWPAHARNTRIAYDGERMQRAVERYHTNRVTDPGCAQPAQGGFSQASGSPASSGGTPCAERPPTPVLPRAGGTMVPRAASGGAQ